MPRRSAAVAAGIPHDSRRQRRFGIGLTVGGLIGAVAAMALLIEKISVLEDPAYIPSCSINPIISCGSVMLSDQAEAFGFPNPLIGIVGFTIVVTLGVVLSTDARLPRWVHLGLGLGAALGTAFIHWLIFQSLYRIGALCPYCMVVWAVTIPLFVAIVVHLLRTDALRPPHWLAGLARVVTEYPAALVTVWFLVVIALITRRFWDYWETLL